MKATSYFDLMQCRTSDGDYCFCFAPGWSRLKPGDIVKTNNAEMTVVRMLDGVAEFAVIDFLNQSGVETKQVLAKVTYDMMNYRVCEQVPNGITGVENSTNDVYDAFKGAEVSE